jgi:hypothetical protein
MRRLSEALERGSRLLIVWERIIGGNRNHAPLNN